MDNFSFDPVNNEFKAEDLARTTYVATVVNLMDVTIEEKKPHLIPMLFKLPAATKDTPGLAYIGEAFWWTQNPLIEEGRPGYAFKQFINPNVLAKSIVDDYNVSNICLAENAEPGLFWLPGRVEPDQLNKKSSKADPRFISIMEKQRAKMKNWYQELCRMADSDWNKSKNMYTVSDLQRMAARGLGISKEWVSFDATEMKACPVCSAPCNVEAMICHNCHFILDPEKFEANKHRFAFGSVAGAGVSTQTLGATKQ